MKDNNSNKSRRVKSYKLNELFLEGRPDAFATVIVEHKTVNEDSSVTYKEQKIELKHSDYAGNLDDPDAFNANLRKLMYDIGGDREDQRRWSVVSIFSNHIARPVIDKHRKHTRIKLYDQITGSIKRIESFLHTCVWDATQKEPSQFSYGVRDWRHPRNLLMAINLLCYRQRMLINGGGIGQVVQGIAYDFVTCGIPPESANKLFPFHEYGINTNPDSNPEITEE